MKPEKRELIHALLDEPHTRREATLLAGSRILRRRRWGRAALRTFAALALLTTTVLSLQRWIPSRPGGSPATPPAQEQAVQSLTDAELLALFPDTPVGLVTLENGRRRLIFPRPGDEERFVKRL